jgi:hypothetical protein
VKTAELTLAAVAVAVERPVEKPRAAETVAQVLF